MTDSLTSSQDKALKIAQQELFIARQTGEAQMKAKAWRDAETQGLKEGTEAFRKYYNVKLATYKQDEANANSKKGASSAASEAKKLANQQETVAQKLENLRQQSELAAGSTQQLSREQAILTAQQSLGAAATQKTSNLQVSMPLQNGTLPTHSKRKPQPRNSCQKRAKTQAISRMFRI